MNAGNASNASSRTPTIGSRRRRDLFSVEVADAPSIPGEGKPRRHPLAADGDYITSFDDGITTLHESFKNAVSKYGRRA